MAMLSIILEERALGRKPAIRPTMLPIIHAISVEVSDRPSV